MPQENLPHLFLRNSYAQVNYTPPQSRGKELRIPQRNRGQHSHKLDRQLNTAWQTAMQISHQRTAISLPTRTGIYLEFKSQVNADLVTQSLENIRSGIRLLNIKEIRHGEEVYTVATVYVPTGKEGYFLKKIQQYSSENIKSGKPKNETLINSIEDIRLAVFESFWPEHERGYMPGNASIWCEVWLRTEINQEEPSARQKTPEEVVDFINLCRQLEIEFQDDYLVFPERAVILAKGDNATLLISTWYRLQFWHEKKNERVLEKI
jgi:hypothetical protein